MVCCFIEHGFPLTELPWLMVVTVPGSIWLLVSPDARWSTLWKPTVVFLVAFAIPFTLHCLKPDIGPKRDGPLDLFLVTSFCQGDTLPPDSAWMPGFALKFYYDYTHYAASVMLRLFDLDMGTGFNMAGSLISGLILFMAGAIAFCVAGQRLWVALLVVLMTATAMDGSTAYLWLFSPQIKEPDDTTIFFNHSGDACAGAFDWLIPHGKDYWAAHEVFPLGYWGWAGCYHSVAAGQFITLLSVLCLVEMFNRPRTNWPWIGSLWSILLMLVCATWGVPMLTLFFLMGAGWCIWRKIYPENWKVVLLVTAGAVTALTPMLLYFLEVRTPAGSMPEEGHTPWQEFVVQWWPAFIPWLLLFFWWKRTHPAVRILQIVLPIMFIVVENYNIGARIDMTGKCWSFIYGAAWVVFLPSLLALRSWTLRGVFAAFVVASALSACFWVDYYHRSIDWDNVGQLTGQGDMRSEPAKKRIFDVVSRHDHQIMIVGKDYWNYAESPILANLTHNKTYIAWYFHCITAFHPDSFDVGCTRDEQVNSLLTGKMADPLAFLGEAKITMVVVWPGDNIDAAVVAKLQQQLAPNFTYVDCRDPDAGPGASPCGVFVSHTLDKPSDGLNVAAVPR